MDTAIWSLQNLLFWSFYDSVILGMTGLGIQFLVIHTQEYLKRRILTTVESYSAPLSVSSFGLKGVFSKPSGKCIVVPNFCFLSWRLQKLATCLFFNFLYLCKVSETLDKLDIRHFIRVPPLMFYVFVIYQKNQRGDPCKMSNINVVHFFSNFAQLKKIKK